MTHWWPGWLLANRKTVLIAFTIFSAISIIFAVQVRFDFNFQEYFPEHDPVRDAYREMLRDFPGEVSEVIIVIDDSSLFSYQGISALLKITHELQAADKFADVNSLVNLPKQVFGTFAPVYERICKGEKFKSSVYKLFRAKTLDNPILSGQLVINHGNAVAIRTTLLQKLANDQGREQVRKYLSQLLAQYASDFDEIFYTGFSSVRADFAETLKEQQSLLLPLVILVLIIVLYLLLGHTWLIILPLCTSIIAMTWTITFMVLGNAPFTILSTATPLLVVIIGISDSLHIFYHLRSDLKEGFTKVQAIMKTFQFLGKSCFLTNITTAIGFLALIVTDLPVLQEFGLYTGLGILLNYIVLMGLLPVLFSVLPEKYLVFESYQNIERFQNKIIDHLINLFHHPTKWLSAFALLMALITIGVKDISEDTRVYQGLTERNRVYQKIQKAESKLGGLLPFGISLETNSDDELTSGNILQHLHTIQAYLETQKQVVGSTFSLVNLANFLLQVETRQHKNVDLTLISAMPFRRRLLKIREEKKNLVDGIVNFEKRKLLIRCRVRDIGSRKFREFLASLQTFLEAHKPDYRWTMTGLPHLSLRLSEKVVTYILLTFSISCGIIFLGFWLGFRSLKMAIISVLPNLIPLLCILGFLGWMQISLQPSVVIVFSIVYGIAVNDTIHFIIRYLKEKKENKREALEITIQSTGKAIISSSVILVVGFVILLFSEFLGLFYLGLLLGVGIVAALFGDLLVLPLTLHRFAE